MKIEIEESALEAIKAMAQRLQDERDIAVAWLFKISRHQQTHQYIKRLADEAIAKCTAEPKVME